jgi:hypothetical protein
MSPPALLHIYIVHVRSYIFPKKNKIKLHALLSVAAVLYYSLTQGSQQE